MTALLLAGCATGKKRKVTFSPTPAQPLVQVLPAQTPNLARVANPVSDPEPVYRNPIIEEVEMAPYVNDEGNLVFPGKMMVIREPGRWNIDAAQKNRSYFVPVDNQPPQLAPPSKSYYDYVQSKKNGAVTAKLDVTKVRVTGFTQKEERPEAVNKLLPGETLVFDPYLGWLAVPSNLQINAPAAQTQNQPATLIQPIPQREATATLPPPTPGAGKPSIEGTSEKEAQLKAILENAFKDVEK